MSYESDYIQQYVGLYEDYLEKVENHAWEDKYGNEHKIEEMETPYLINCLNKINREEDFRQEYKEIIEDELERRKRKNARNKI